MTKLNPSWDMGTWGGIMWWVRPFYRPSKSSIACLTGWYILGIFLFYRRDRSHWYLELIHKYAGILLVLCLRFPYRCFIHTQCFNFSRSLFGTCLLEGWQAQWIRFQKVRCTHSPIYTFIVIDSFHKVHSCVVCKCSLHIYDRTHTVCELSTWLWLWMWMSA